MDFKKINKKQKINQSERGFTLIELLVVIAIFGILTAIVVFNYGKFTSETVLTNMAYEVALTIREAQIYGVSTVGESADFGSSYGVHFWTGGKSYQLFKDSGTYSNQTLSTDDVNCTSSSSECVTQYELQRNITFTSLYGKGSGGTCRPLTSLAMVFNRPNPEPRIYLNNDITYVSAQISLSYPDGSPRYIIVNKSGAIYVTNSPICS